MVRIPFGIRWFTRQESWGGEVGSRRREEICPEGYSWSCRWHEGHRTRCELHVCACLHVMCLGVASKVLLLLWSSTRWFIDVHPSLPSPPLFLPHLPHSLPPSVRSLTDFLFSLILSSCLITCDDSACSEYRWNTRDFFFIRLYEILHSWKEVF